MDNQTPDFTSECIFTTSRSSGPGGQHVNKTESKVELRFNVLSSSLLNDEQKNILIVKLKSKLVENGSTILISSQQTRSQLKNKNITLKKLHDLITESLTESEPRVPTKPTKQSKERRIAEKKKIAEKKASRSNIKDKELDL